MFVNWVIIRLSSRSNFNVTKIVLSVLVEMGERLDTQTWIRATSFRVKASNRPADPLEVSSQGNSLARLDVKSTRV